MRALLEAAAEDSAILRAIDRIAVATTMLKMKCKHLKKRKTKFKDFIILIMKEKIVEKKKNQKYNA
jgi:hypothetical protein